MDWLAPILTSIRGADEGAEIRLIMARISGTFVLTPFHECSCVYPTHGRLRTHRSAITMGDDEHLDSDHCSITAALC
jgi:hypothetical protein